MKLMQTKYVFSKTSKKQILTVTLQNYAKINFKRLYKNLSYLSFHEFLCNIFQTDLIKNVKTILAYFYFIKTI